MSSNACMITKAEMTAEAFRERQARPRTRWAELLETLKSANVGEVFNVALRQEENTGEGRQRARQSIYSIARYHHISVSFISRETVIQVMKSGG